MRRLALFLLTLISTQLAAVELIDIQTTLQKQGNFSAALLQEKQLKTWSRPLKAQGQLLFSQQNGVIYQLDKPLQAVYWLRAGQIDVLENGHDLRHLNATAMPWLDSITRLLNSGLSGDWNNLRQQFTLHLHDSTESSWQLTLTPRDSTLQKAMRRITLSGNQRIEHILIVDSKDDQTLITLSAHRALDQTGWQSAVNVFGNNSVN